MTKKGGIKAHGGPIANHLGDHLLEVCVRLVLIGEKLHLPVCFLLKDACGCRSSAFRPVEACRIDLMPRAVRGIMQAEEENSRAHKNLYVVEWCNTWCAV